MNTCMSPAEDNQKRQEEGIDLENLSSPQFYKQGGLPFRNINLTMNIPRSNERAIHQPSPLFMSHPKRHIPMVNSPNNQTPTKFSSPNLYLSVQKSSRHAMMSPVALTPQGVKRPTIIIPKRDNGEVAEEMPESGEETPKFQRFKEDCSALLDDIKQTRTYKRATSVSWSNIRRTFNMFTIVLLMLIATVIVHLIREPMLRNANIALLVVGIVWFFVNILAQFYRSTFIMATVALANAAGLTYVAVTFFMALGNNSFIQTLGTLHVGSVLLLLSFFYSIAYTVTYYKEGWVSTQTEQTQCEEVVSGNAPESPSTFASATTIEDDLASGPMSTTTIVPLHSSKPKREDLRSLTMSPYVVVADDAGDA